MHGVMVMSTRKPEMYRDGSFSQVTVNRTERQDIGKEYKNFHEKREDKLFPVNLTQHFQSRDWS